MRKRIFICVLICFQFLSGNVVAHSHVSGCQIDQDQSNVVIRVYKEGKLSSFGDNHLISTSVLQGRIGLNRASPGESRFILSVPTQSLIVNDPKLRAEAEAAFNTKVSALNRKITRNSMLGKKVLYAKKYPEIRIQGLSLPDQLSGVAEMAITLRETTRTEQVTLETEIKGEQLRIRGQFSLNQSDYGIAPFSIMFGGIRVKDALRLNFDLLSRCALS